MLTSETAPPAPPAPRPLVQWRRGFVEYRIRRGDRGALLLLARGPGRNVRAISLAPVKRRARASATDAAHYTTSGWRGISARERTLLAELILKQSRGVLHRLT